jgi:AraC family transcriptional regulator
MSPDRGDPRARFGRSQAIWRFGAAEMICSPPAEQRFRTEANLIGMALGDAHRVEFAFSSDRSHRYLMVPGDIQLVPPGVEHFVRWEECQFCLVSVDREQVLAITEGAGNGQLTASPRVKMRDPLVEQLMRALGREARFFSPGHGRAIYRQTLASALAAQLVFGQSTLPAFRPGQARRRIGARRLQRAIDYVDAHLGEDLTLTALADVAEMSPWHFARMFKAATGEPPHRYVTARRLARASELLSTERHDVEEVARRVGARGAHQLRRLYQRHLGAVPWRGRRARGKR